MTVALESYADKVAATVRNAAVRLGRHVQLPLSAVEIADLQQRSRASHENNGAWYEQETWARRPGKKLAREVCMAEEVAWEKLRGDSVW